MVELSDEEIVDLWKGDEIGYSGIKTFKRALKVTNIYIISLYLYT